MDKQKPRYFGTDGIRGTVGQHPMTLEFVRDLGRAIGRYFAERNISRLIIIRDTRASGEMLGDALTEGLTLEGCDVVRAGVLPTGAAAFLARKHKAGAAVISASHNPASDNGVKVFTEKGFKLSQEQECAIEAIMSNLGQPSAQKGTATTDSAMKEEYLTFLKEQADDSVRTFLRENRIVLDCAHGSASTIAPELFSKLGLKDNVTVLSAEPDGTNINEGCGALHTDKVAEAVKKHNANIGFAFDGDADRLIAADEKSQLLNGDRVMAVLAAWLKKQGKLSDNVVVATPYSNLGLRAFLNGRECTLEIVPNGDRFVTEKMRENGYSLGGEQSGHIVIMPPGTTGDALLTVITLLKVMADSGEKLSALHSGFTECPQCLLNIKVRDKPPLKTLKNVQHLIHEAESALGKNGRAFVRYSGTEKLARVLVECFSKEEAQDWAEKIAKAIEEEIGN